MSAAGPLGLPAPSRKGVITVDNGTPSPRSARYHYLITYEIRDMISRMILSTGERFNSSEHRLVTPGDFDQIRTAIQASCAGMPMPGDTVQGDIALANLGGRVLITGVFLLATPADVLDDEEWRNERNVAQLARDAAYCWQELLPAERTFIGDQTGYSRLANALDALLTSVR